ncbi:hypothetical protein [Pseudovibrio sp. Tun.PSC04-5.I4]|uniref:hypothetical protein n=1 Tax=Pseudovibrio sp. Tun.PSC04-5.I4 TaxID=1798213 RepID=UPI000B886274|nr:hypothetical protein [Pseudovibrio sp. Tun.PSC04-5.I4]
MEIARCSSPDYVGAEEVLAQDLLGAVDYFRDQPCVIADQIVLVGHLQGGSVSLAAANKTLRAVAA